MDVLIFAFSMLAVGLAGKLLLHRWQKRNRQDGWG